MTTHIHLPRTMLEVYKSLPEGTRVQLINDKIKKSSMKRGYMAHLTL